MVRVPLGNRYPPLKVFTPGQRDRRGPARLVGGPFATDDDERFLLCHGYAPSQRHLSLLDCEPSRGATLHAIVGGRVLPRRDG